MGMGTQNKTNSSAGDSENRGSSPVQGKKPDDNSHIAWHPAFVEAIQLELEDYKDVLEFHPEYQLTKEPLRIDCVVIKKDPDVVINKNIAAIFRNVNLLEYKSPVDYVSVADFYKVYAYACLYASIEMIPIDSITVSFIESRCPEKLLAHLKNVRRYIVEETVPGIYTAKGDILPIQIIDSRKLSVDENLWLKDLGDKLAPLEIRRVLAEIRKQGKEARIGAYLDVITRANKESLRGTLTMSYVQFSALEEVLEEVGITAKIEAKIQARIEAKIQTRAEARGKEREAFNIAQKMVNLGLSPETVVSATELDPEKVKAMYQNK